jgi:UDP-glucose 4-epimerase
MRNVFVTGAAGFIGSTLVDRLLDERINVVGFDNLSSGQERFIKKALGNKFFKFVKGDTLNINELISAMEGCDTVFHLAANADVRFGIHHPRKDLEQNTIATFNVLEAARLNTVKQLAFSSTGSVYGESNIIPTPENAPFPIQTSLYGASKIAGEGLISAFGEGFGIQGYIFRFVSILGERYTHGHIFDFHKQLKVHPEKLKILGDGTQRKSYLYVQDCIDAMLHVMRLETAKKAPHLIQVYNLGTSEFVQVNDSVKIIIDSLNLKPTLEYTGGNKGWIGDNPFIFLETKKITATGWKPKLTIKEGIIKTLHWLESNEWVYEARIDTQKKE